MKIKIILTVTDVNVLYDYDKVHPDLIADDFRANPDAWIFASDIEVKTNAKNKN